MGVCFKDLMHKLYEQLLYLNEMKTPSPIQTSNFIKDKVMLNIWSVVNNVIMISHSGMYSKAQTYNLSYSQVACVKK